MVNGCLKNGNPRGDPSTAPRCGARTRRGTPCQAPALREKRRCRLHGGLSTGPKTSAGLARIRAAKTKHGRYSAEQRALNQMVREYQREGRYSAYSFPKEFRERMRQLASEPPSQNILAQMREMVRDDLAREERERLERLSPGGKTS